LRFEKKLSLQQLMDSNILFALGLTSFAGLSTGFGSAIAFFAKRTNTKF